MALGLWGGVEEEEDSEQRQSVKQAEGDELTQKRHMHGQGKEGFARYLL
jgi:hypothetical protein